MEKAKPQQFFYKNIFAFSVSNLHFTIEKRNQIIFIWEIDPITKRKSKKNILY